MKEQKGSRRGEREEADSTGSSSHETLSFPLQSKHLSAHLKHSLEAFSSAYSVLSKPLNGKLLDAVLDLLPTTAQSDDLGRLIKHGMCGGRGGRGTVNDSFADGEKIGPGHVLAAHGDLLGFWVDVGGFIDVRDFLATEERVEPFRR